MKQPTKRETEVWRGLASGKSIVEIAEYWGLSEKTVQAQRQSLQKALGMKNLADLTHLAIRRGLVELKFPEV